MTRSVGLFFDLAGCQIAGHFSMFNSDRIFSTTCGRTEDFAGAIAVSFLAIGSVTVIELSIESVTGFAIKNLGHTLPRLPGYRVYLERYLKVYSASAHFQSR